MNRFYDLPNEIQYKIFNFVKISHVNTIIKAWKRYYNFKKFIINMAYTSPIYNSSVDGDIMYNVSHQFTKYYFNILNNIITGNESYIQNVYVLICAFAISINDYEYYYDIDDINYSFNKFYCTSISNKLNWHSILYIID